MYTNGTIPPTPRLPALAQSALLFADPVWFLEQCRRRLGPVFRVRLVGFPRYAYVADPQLAREVYATDRTVGLAGAARRDFLAPLVGEHSLLCTDGEEWLRHRKLLGPVFHRSHVDGYAGEIAAIAGRHIERWPVGEPFELRSPMQEITLEVILRLVFGVTEEERLERFRRVLPAVVDAVGGPLLWLVPPAAWRSEEARRRLRRIPGPLRSFLIAKEEADALIYEEIDRRRRSEDAARSDVLSMLLQARDEDGRAMTDVELRDELMTLLMAGHETTATGLAWAFERLLRNPAALDRLVDELDGGGEEYLDAVVRETLRARPVVLDTPRLLDAPLELGGHLIPRGWYVAPAIPTVQHDPRAVPDPDQFRPERFESDPPRDAWIPFGGGKRHCVGSHLALLEMRTVIAEVLARLRLEAATPAPERQRVRHVTLVPGRGARVVARPRRAATVPALAASAG